MQEGKKIEQMPCEQFLQGFEISRAFLCVKREGEKHWKIQNPIKIAHKADILFFLSLKASPAYEEPLRAKKT